MFKIEKKNLSNKNIKLKSENKELEIESKKSESENKQLYEDKNRLQNEKVEFKMLASSKSDETKSIKQKLEPCNKVILKVENRWGYRNF